MELLNATLRHGWMIAVEINDLGDDLLDADAYEKYIEQVEGRR